MPWNDAPLEDGPIPLWHQIAERLRLSIDQGEFTSGDRLPSEAELFAAFGVSRTTARTALDSLEHDGLISRRSGKGSILLAKIDQPSQRLAGFAEDMRLLGLKPSYRTRAIRQIDCPHDWDELFAFKPRQKRKLIEVERLLLANKKPVGLSRSWFAPLLLGLKREPQISELDEGSLYAWIEDQSGRAILSGEEFVSATVADAPTAAILDTVEGFPLLSVARTTRDGSGATIEYAELVYRADRYRLRVDLVRK
ncbi:GntR family transcriptional regulator [Acidisoma cellulosilytica]|uniref:GntR family transcriptional regulator n=1 Tax=Acidisoma cellulosilyticum TaxID=2802395 RepID=A0A964E4K6_9PROT|nr:GntR family transcriptional regulator [Acidisoma cellulosilyticum]MCB8881073.1 GntR family transcriptional regulator [Acidisoma cellulosilyticum]